MVRYLHGNLDRQRKVVLDADILAKLKTCRYLTHSAHLGWFLDNEFVSSAVVCLLARLCNHLEFIMRIFFCWVVIKSVSKVEICSFPSLSSLRQH